MQVVTYSAELQDQAISSSVMLFATLLNVFFLQINPAGTLLAIHGDNDQ